MKNMDFSEIEFDEEDMETMAKDISILSGFELGAINTVMADAVTGCVLKYDEFTSETEFAEESPEVQKANQYGFLDIPEPMPKNKYTH